MAVSEEQAHVAPGQAEGTIGGDTGHSGGVC